MYYYLPTNNTDDQKYIDGEIKRQQRSYSKCCSQNKQIEHFGNNLTTYENS